jgi:ABC-type transporter Mla MlaB component
VLEKVPQGVELQVNLNHLKYLDHACLELLQNWQKQHEQTGGRLITDWGQLQSCLQAANGKSPVVFSPPSPMQEEQQV